MQTLAAFNFFCSKFKPLELCGTMEKFSIINLDCEIFIQRSTLCVLPQRCITWKTKTHRFRNNFVHFYFSTQKSIRFNRAGAINNAPGFRRHSFTQWKLLIHMPVHRAHHMEIHFCKIQCLPMIILFYLLITLTLSLVQEDETLAENTEIIDSSQGNVFESVLKLKRIDHNYVGYYYCVKISADDMSLEDAFQNFRASRIYLFVDGKLILIWWAIVLFFIWRRNIKQNFIKRKKSLKRRRNSN